MSSGLCLCLLRIIFLQSKFFSRLIWCIYASQWKVRSWNRTCSSLKYGVIQDKIFKVQLFINEITENVSILLQVLFKHRYCLLLLSTVLQYLMWIFPIQRISSIPTFSIYEYRHPSWSPCYFGVWSSMQPSVTKNRICKHYYYIVRISFSLSFWKHCISAWNFQEASIFLHHFWTKMTALSLSGWGFWFPGRFFEFLLRNGLWRFLSFIADMK